MTAIGDVLRVDLATDSAFPNGRVIYGGTNHEDDVTDILLSVLLTKAPIAESATGSTTTTRSTSTARRGWRCPGRGFDQGHGKPTP